MKQIIFYILSIEPNENALKYHEKHKNNLIKYNTEQKGFYFCSKFNNCKELIKYEYEKIELNENIIIIVKTLLNSSIQEALKISKETMSDDENEIQMLNDAIISIINKYSYYDETHKKDIFDLAEEIFTRILMGHYLKNGNKRTAIVFLKNFLWYYGYYFKFTQTQMWKDYSRHKTFVEGFVKKLENKGNKNNIETHKQIKKWILNNVIIGLNWR